MFKLIWGSLVYGRAYVPGRRGRGLRKWKPEGPAGPGAGGACTEAARAVVVLR